jgi:hypothetical protein
VLKPMKAAAAAAALCLFLGGCDGGGGSVSGTVTLDGKPLTSGVVTFHPAAGGASAIGTIGKDGTYTVQIGNDMKLPPGDYLVTVDAGEAVTSDLGPPGAPPKPPPPPKRITPDKYASKDTTDLKATVKAGSNKVPLELKGGK